MGLLSIYFEGYWQCRQATDPDPSDDPRGASGYTFAVGAENDLDMTIRLQRDEIPDIDFRDAPEPNYPNKANQQFGIFVTHTTYRSQASADHDKSLPVLNSGKVRWLDVDGRGPRFELRNTITYHPLNGTGIFMPIVPLHFSIESQDGKVLIQRNDPLDTKAPDKPVWEMPTAEYLRRCPKVFYGVSDEAMEAVGISQNGANNFQAYFEQRKEWLQLQRLEAKTALERAAYSTRIGAITSDVLNPRITSRLSLLAQWEHDLRGSHITIEGEAELGGAIDREAPWPVRYWMGGYDGDVMRGYMRGTLEIPFTPYKIL